MLIQKRASQSYEDPVDRKRKEREDRIKYEQQELATLIVNDPFAKLGG